MVASAPSSLVYKPVGGRLAGFMSHWLHTTDDTYVLWTISEGIRLEFLERPPLVESPLLFTRNAKREAELCGGDGQQGGIRASPAAISRLLQQPLVQKKSGGLRPVINLKPLNLFIKKEKFKMETTRSIWKACLQAIG